MAYPTKQDRRIQQQRRGVGRSICRYCRDAKRPLEPGEIAHKECLEVAPWAR